MAKPRRGLRVTLHHFPRVAAARQPWAKGRNAVGVGYRQDDSFIAGPDSVQYTVQGTRSNQLGPVSPIFTVSFGRLPDGMATATVSASNSGTYAADKALVDAIVNSGANAGSNGKMVKSRG